VEEGKLASTSRSRSKVQGDLNYFNTFWICSMTDTKFCNTYR
jgi:hypothetical protein